MSYSKEPTYVQKALDVLARFGYLRKEIFFSYLSADSRSSKFRSWKILLDTGYLEPYNRSFIGEDVFKLSGRGRRLLENPVGAAHPLYFEHDDNLVHFSLSSLKKGLIAGSYLSEKMMRQMPPSDLIEILGHCPEKLPDLVFEVDLSSGPVRVALEVERTRKSKQRYDTWVQAYSKAKGVDLVVLAYKDRSVAEAIRESILQNAYPQSLRPVAFVKISDLQKS